MANVGYRRVSSRDQNPDRQLAEVEISEMFTDKYSGKTTDRPALQDCLRYLRKGDILHVHSMDRLARNLLDLQIVVEKLVKEGIQVKFHKESLIFSGDSNPMNKLILQVMGAVAEMELALIRERQREGIKAARKRGVQWGAPAKATEAMASQIKMALAEGKNKSQIARGLGISRNTLYKALRRTYG